MDFELKLLFLLEKPATWVAWGNMSHSSVGPWSWLFLLPLQRRDRDALLSFECVVLQGPALFTKWAPATFQRMSIFQTSSPARPLLGQAVTEELECISLV